MKHKWILDERGNIDMWQFEADFHNGPKCELCGFSFCALCNPEYMDADDCPGMHPLIAVPRTRVNKIPPSMTDETEPCIEFIEEFCNGTGLANDTALNAILWLWDHGYVSVENLMVEADYDGE